MKYVYSFNEGNKDMKNILGGKGANIAEMRKMGLPVPDGFTVTTEACNQYYENGETISETIKLEIEEHLKELEKNSGKKFGFVENPLLVSVRSGARASMPGMMDTILNLGINDEVAKAYSVITNNPRFVMDSYRRFIQMFADVAMGLPKGSFERVFDNFKKSKNKTLDNELTSDELAELIEIYKEEYRKLAGEEFPQDPKIQLMRAVEAVFRSWNNDRAITYRRLNNIPSTWGTAVNIQEMVFGNSGDDSGTGVAFTRNPATGEKKMFGEFLMNAQGEDVVAGIRTPNSIETLKDINENVYLQFCETAKKLEEHYRDMQDMEFTIEKGKLFLLQTRNGKRTAEAALKIAVDLVDEGMITKEEAIMKVEPQTLDQLLHPVFDEKSLKIASVKTVGLAASPGAACGKLYFTAEELKKAHEDGEKDLILARLETSPEDIEGMLVAHGIMTVHGGMTSHAAVVARGLGTCCVSGCSDVVIDEHNKTVTFKDGTVVKEGEYLSLDGSTGNVYAEKIPTVEKEISGNFARFIQWADDIRRLKIKANADNKRDAEVARKFGAEGIGLCRTEHMFFDEKRIFSFRKMILAETLEQREQALAEILPYQKEDFKDLFRTMKDLSVIIRFLDPPLHEFLPHKDSEIKELAESLGLSFEEVKNKVENSKEFNPMMGHRGCRLAITYPEIARMQARAVMEANIEVLEEGIQCLAKIMIPLVGDKNELNYLKNIVDEEIQKVFEEKGTYVKYLIGTMIETPRSTVVSNQIAELAEFYSFGTNDLTQMTFGFSRDDASKFLKDYYDKSIFELDPFAHLDKNGVAELMKMAIEKGRKVRPDIEVGICGEHGGDPYSIDICESLQLDYVSCSPYRVPIARLSAAQAVIKNKQ